MSNSVLVNFPREAPRSPPVVGARRPAGVRSFGENDLEPVADLFLQRFRASGRGARAREELAACMKALYLDHPTRDGEADALVSVDADGAIAAFCGGVRATFQFDGRPAKACITGTLMASPAPGHAMAALQILRERRRREYDLFVTDSANRSSLAICQASNYQVVSPDSLEWACVFDPASLALHKVGQRLGLSWLRALRPLARGADLAAGAAVRAAQGAGKPSGWRDAEVDAEAFVEIAPRFLEPYRLRPNFSKPEFLWLIDMAKRRRSAGPLHLRVIYDAAGTPAGAYAAFGGKGDVARVFHAVAAPHAWGRLFDKMRDSARERGCIAIHGPLRQPMLAHAYSVRGVFFYYAGGMLAYSDRPEIRRAIASGEAMLGGFAGDRWTQLASDHFG
ncbi:MAG: hypothetical protein KGM15_11375 [Pseudomonadota bacterium]|nr:hypothetical protein [Pseudomonadota bacterium]